MAPVPRTGPLVPPQGLDVTIPNVARIYDWLLGGKDNFAADREAGQRLLAAVPDAAKAARANRAFLGRAVRFLAEEAGIRQFLDIGTGLPTQGNVHEIAQASDPRTRVVYCDHDPIVVTHANALLANNLTVAASQADLRDPDFLFTLPLAHPMSVFHPAISRAWRTWMALASWPACQGQQRSLRRIPQVLSWALARSPGARSFAWAELAAFWEGGLFRPR